MKKGELDPPEEVAKILGKSVKAVDVYKRQVMLILKKEDGTCIRCSKDWLELHAGEVCIL